MTYPSWQCFACGANGGEPCRMPCANVNRMFGKLGNMATKNSNGNGGSVETKQLKTPKPGELLKLFKEYDKAQQAYLDAEAALAEASQKRSVAVQAIAEFGNGPFEWPAKSGKLLTPTSRTNKESGKVSHFFKGQGEQRIQQVT